MNEGLVEILRDSPLGDLFAFIGRANNSMEFKLSFIGREVECSLLGKEFHAVSDQDGVIPFNIQIIFHAF